MKSEAQEVVPGLSSADVTEMVEKVFACTDGNHPQISEAENGFIDILQNGKSDISASSTFIRKVSL